jgi:hypothetical protein
VIRKRRDLILSTLSTILGVLTIGPSATAGSVTGTVTNQGTGLGMPGVAVSLFDPAGDPMGSVTTDSNGTYSFNNVSAGNYLIQENIPNGFYQTNPTFPNYGPTPQSTPANYGTSSGNWNYTGSNGTVGPPSWVTSGTPAPFESALNLTGPTVNLGTILQENYTNTNQYTQLLKNTSTGQPGYQIQATSFGVPESVSVNGTPFNLSNIHFHDPTENTVNGASPGVMEEHFVNVS